MVRNHRNQSRDRTLGGKSGLKSDVLSEIRNQPSLDIIAEIKKSVFEILYAKWIIADPSLCTQRRLIQVEVSQLEKDLAVLRFLIPQKRMDGIEVASPIL